MAHSSKLQYDPGMDAIKKNFSNYEMLGPDYAKIKTPKAFFQQFDLDQETRPKNDPFWENFLPEGGKDQQQQQPAATLAPVPGVSYGDSFGANLHEGWDIFLAEGGNQLGYLLSEFELTEDIGADLLQWSKDQKAPEPDDSWGQFFGGIAPQTVGYLGAVALGLVPIPGARVAAAGLLASNVALLSGVSMGTGLQTYDVYKKSKGEVPDPIHRWYVGTAYLGAELSMEWIGARRMLGRGATQRGIKALLTKFSPEQAEQSGKRMVNDWLNKVGRKKGVNAIKAMARAAHFEGKTEAATEIFQSITDNWYREVEDKYGWREIANRIRTAYGAGAVMGSSISTLSYQGQLKATNDRRKAQGGVAIGKLKDGNMVELLEEKTGKKETMVMFPSGRIEKVLSDEISEDHIYPLEQFNNILKGKYDEASIEAAERNLQVEKVKEVAYGNINKFIVDHPKSPPVIGPDGKGYYQRGEYEDKDVMVVGKLESGRNVFFNMETGEMDDADPARIENLEPFSLDQIASELSNGETDKMWIDPNQVPTIGDKILGQISTTPDGRDTIVPVTDLRNEIEFTVNAVNNTDESVVMEAAEKLDIAPIAVSYDGFQVLKNNQPIQPPPSETAVQTIDSSQLPINKVVTKSMAIVNKDGKGQNIKVVIKKGAVGQDVVGRFETIYTEEKEANNDAKSFNEAYPELEATPVRRSKKTKDSKWEPSKYDVQVKERVAPKETDVIPKAKETVTTDEPTITPTVDDKSVAEEKKAAVAEEKKAAVAEEKTATIEEKTATIEEKAAVVEEKKTAAVEEKAAVVEEKTAVAEEKTAAVEEKKTAAVEKKKTVVAEKTKAATALLEDVQSKMPILSDADYLDIASKMINPYLISQRARVQGVVDRFKKGISSEAMPNIHVWGTYQDYMLYKKGKSPLEDEIVLHPDLIRSFVDREGEVHIISDHKDFSGIKTIEFVLLHEITGHIGVNGLLRSLSKEKQSTFGKEWRDLMDEVLSAEGVKDSFMYEKVEAYFGFTPDQKRDRDKLLSEFNKIEAKITSKKELGLLEKERKEWRKKHDKFFKKVFDDLGIDDQRTLAEEHLADMAGSQQTGDLMDRVISFFRRLYRNILNKDLKLNDAEMRSIIGSMKRSVRVGVDNYAVYRDHDERTFSGKAYSRTPVTPQETRKKPASDLKFSKSQTQVTKANAQLLSNTLRVLKDKMLAGMSGREVKRVTVQQILNQPTTKDIEKEILGDILSREEFAGNQFDFDAFKLAVELELMPLEQLKTSKWADYGASDIGINPDDAQSVVYNSHLDHGFGDHFRSLFSGDLSLDKIRPKTEWEIQKVPERENTYVALDKNRPEGISAEELQNYVGTAGSQERVKQWVETQEKANAETPNQGVFAFVRRWDVGPDERYIAEIQSDQYQKRRPEELVRTDVFERPAASKLKTEITQVILKIHKSPDWVKKAYDEVTATVSQFNEFKSKRQKEQKVLRKNEADIIKGNKLVEDLKTKSKEEILKAEVPSFRVIQTDKGKFQELDDRLTKKYKTSRYITKLTDADKELHLSAYKASEKSEEGLPYRIEVNGKDVTPAKPRTPSWFGINLHNRDQIVGLYFDERYKPLRQTMKDVANLLIGNDPAVMHKTFRRDFERITISPEEINRDRDKIIVTAEKEAEKKIEELSSGERGFKKVDKQVYDTYRKLIQRRDEIKNKELPKLYTLKDKQFIAHRKNYPERVIREEIKQGAIDGKKVMYFPMPHTIATIEGYVSVDDEFGALPYVTNNNHRNDLVAGEDIEYAGEDMTVVKADEYDIKVAPAKDVNSWNLDSYISEEVEVYMEEIREEFGEQNNIDELEYMGFQKPWNVNFKESLRKEFADDEGLVKFSDIEDKLSEWLSEHSYVATDPIQTIEELGYEVFADEGARDVYVVADGAAVENFKQPDQYDEVSREDFDINDLSSVEQTVVNHYVEAGEFLKTEREGNIEEVEDDNNYGWWKTNITEEDRSNPVILYSKSIEPDQRFPRSIEKLEDQPTSETGETSKVFEITDTPKKGKEIKFSKEINRTVDIDKIPRATLAELKGGKGFVFAADRASVGEITSPTGYKHEFKGGPLYSYLPKVGAWAFTTEGSAKKILNRVNESDGIGLIMLQGDEGIKGSNAFLEYTQGELEHAISKGSSEKEIVDFINSKLDTVPGKAILAKGGVKIETVGEFSTLMPFEGKSKVNYEERGNFLEIVFGAEFEKRFGVPRLKYGDNVKNRPNPTMLDYVNDPMFKDHEYGDVVGAIQFNKGAEVIDTRGNDSFDDHPSYPFIIEGKPLMIFENAYDVREVAPDFVPAQGSQTPLSERAKPQAARTALLGQPMVKFSREISPNFYSTTIQALVRVNMNKAPAEQWKKTLENMGASNAEMKWMGIDDFFAENPKPTKQALMEFMEANQVKVVEIIKRDDRAEGYLSNLKFIHRKWDEYDRLPYEALNPGERDALEDWENEYGGIDELGDKISSIENEDAVVDSGGIRHGSPSLNLPGGKNPIELLMILPHNPLDKAGKELANFEAQFESKPIPVDMQDEHERLRENIALAKSTASEKFHHPNHWEEPNVLAHIRFNERTTSDGNRVMFIEELQSDWAQEGRKQGFKEMWKPEQLRVLPKEEALSKHDIEDSVWAVEAKNPDGTIGQLFTILKSKKKTEKEVIDYIVKEKPELDSGVPQTPFKTTDQWLKLTLRRAIRYAADNGYDGVAWTTGEQQADRYDLSKQINMVSASKNDDGNYQLIVEDKTGQELEDYRGSGKKVTPQEMEDTIGKEVSKKLMEGADRNFGKPWPKKMKVNPEFFTMGGLDLKIGGEGITYLYNTVVPKNAGKVLQKLDKSIKLEEVQFGEVELRLTDKENAELSSLRGRNIRDLSEDEQERLNELQNKASVVNYDREAPSFTATGFYLTPHVKDKAIREGMPLFSKSIQLAPDKLSSARWRDDLYTQFVNYMHYMDMLQRKEYPKGDIPDYINIVQIENIGKNVVRHKQGQVLVKHFQPIIDAVRDLHNHNNTLTREVTETYLKSKHILEDKVMSYSYKKTGDDVYDVKVEGEGHDGISGGEFKALVGSRNYKVIQERVARVEKSNKSLKKSKKITGKYTGGGISMADAKANVKDFEDKAKTSLYNNLNKEIKKLVEYINSEESTTGEISAAVSKKRMTEFKHYVPLRGFKEIEDTDKTFFTKSTVQRKGRTSESGSPIAYLQAMAQTAIVTGQRNIVMVAFHNFAVQNPNSKLYKIRNAYYYMEGDDIVETADKPKGADGKPGKIHVDYERSLGELGIEADDNVNLVVKKVEGLMETISFKLNGKQQYIDFHGIDGMRVGRGLKKTDVAEVHGVLNFVRKFSNILRQVYTTYSPEFGPRNFTRDFFTGTINIRNDFGNAMALRVAGNTRSSFVALRKLLKKGGMDVVYADGSIEKQLAEYIESGGLIGWTEMKSVQDFSDEMKRNLKNLSDFSNDPSFKGLMTVGGQKLKGGLNTLMQGMDFWNKVFENTMRFNAYRQMVKPKDKGGAGMTKQKAIKYSLDLTTNFNTKGSLSNAIGSLFLFFNTSMQGVDRMLKPFGGIEGILKIDKTLKGTSDTKGIIIKKIAKRAAITAAALPAAQFISGMMNQILGGEDDNEEPYYNKISEYVRTHNLIFPVGKNKFIYIPMPYGYNSLIGWVEYARDYLEGRSTGSDAALKTFTLVSESFSPLGAPNLESGKPLEAISEYIAPTAVKPIVELMFNRNFMGFPIAREGSSFGTPLPDHKQYYDSVSPFSKLLTDFWAQTIGGSDSITPPQYGIFDINPESIDHLVGTYTGGVGTFLRNSYGTAVGIAKKIQGTPMTENERILKKVPWIRNYYQETSPSFNRNKYFENVRMVKEKNTYYKRYISAGRLQAAKDYSKENQGYIKLFYWSKAFDKSLDLFEKVRDQSRVEGNNADVLMWDRRMNDKHMTFNKMFNAVELGKNPNVLFGLQEQAKKITPSFLKKIYRIPE